MATPWGINDNKNNSTELYGYEWNHLVRAANFQTQAALEAHGKGVIHGFSVTKTGLSTVAVTAGFALVEDGDQGYIALKDVTRTLNFADTTEFSGEYEDADYYLCAGILNASAQDEPDSVEGGAVDWRLELVDDDNGAIAIARVTFAAGAIQEVQDVRTFLPVQKMAQDILQLQEEVADLNTRLALIENGDGETPGPAGPVYLAQLKWSAEDPRSSDIVLQEKLDALEARLSLLVESGGRIPTESRMDLYAHQQAVLIHKVGEENPQHTLDFEGAYVQRGLFGEGHGNTENHIVVTTLTETDRGWMP